MQGYRIALQCNPEHIPTLHGMGEVYFTQGNYPAAIDCFQQALKYMPGFPEAHFSWVYCGMLSIIPKRPSIVSDKPCTYVLNGLMAGRIWRWC